MLYLIHFFCSNPSREGLLLSLFLFMRKQSFREVKCLPCSHTAHKLQCWNVNQACLTSEFMVCLLDKINTGVKLWSMWSGKYIREE